MVTYMACDFNNIDKNGGKSFDEESFAKYIASPKTQEKIKGKIMLGTLSHKARVDYENELKKGNLAIGTPSDYLLATNQAATYISDMYIKDHKLYITVCTLPFPMGIALEKLIDLDVNILVSMSTELRQDMDHYYIVNLFGLDHTTSPAFNTEVVSMSEVGGAQ
jgi:hypothetical protein